MKRTLALTAAFLLIACMPLAALAEGEEPVLITVSTVDGTQDAQVDVAVDLSACIGVDSIYFNLNYDPAALSVVTVVPGLLVPVEYCITNKDESGRVRVACACAEGMTEEGTLLTVRFKVLSAAGSALTVTDGIVTLVDAENDYAQSEGYVALQGGGVTVNGASVPAAQVTPWVPKTPEPTPSPTPEPTQEPEAAVIQTTPEPSPSPTPAPVSGEAGPASYVVVAVLFALLVTLIVLMSRRSRGGKGKGKGKKKRGRDNRA